MLPELDWDWWIGFGLAVAGLAIVLGTSWLVLWRIARRD